MAAFVYVIQHVTMELDVISNAPAMEYVMINLNVSVILLLVGVVHIVHLKHSIEKSFKLCCVVGTNIYLK
jgi:hypothetical protein